MTATESKRISRTAFTHLSSRLMQPCNVHHHIAGSRHSSQFRICCWPSVKVQIVRLGTGQPCAPGIVHRRATKVVYHHCGSGLRHPSHQVSPCEHHALRGCGVVVASPGKDVEFGRRVKSVAQPFIPRSSRWVSHWSICRFSHQFLICTAFASPTQRCLPLVRRKQ